MRSADECVAAPPLCAFLAAVKCAHHADTMTKLGFGHGCRIVARALALSRSGAEPAVYVRALERELYRDA